VGFGNMGFGNYGYDHFNTVFSHFGNVRQENLNITSNLSISFLDARADHSREVSFTRKIICKHCKGSGAKSFYSKNCFNCHGTGVSGKVIGGLLQIAKTCSTCKGHGKQIKDICSHCHSGFVSESTKVNVNIPAGIINGKTLRLAREGNQSKNGVGDLRIQVNVRPPKNPTWERKGADVHSKLAVDYPTLILGGEAEVETIWGKETLRIPPRTRCGQILMMPNKGFPRLGRLIASERGLHYAHVDLLIPGDSSKDHINLLSALRDLYNK
jgi:molecular chaperone DnaJ